MALLEVEDLRVGYGHVEAIHTVSLAVEEGETLAVIGANGAGKSTLLNCLAGLVAPTEGTVRFAGADVTREPAHRRVRRGIALVPEGSGVFASLTVDEHLRVGAHARRPGPWTRSRVLDLLDVLHGKEGRRGDRLSGGERQALAIGRALMAQPRLLLLDEVSLGLAPVVVRRLYAALPTIVGEGTTVLIVEQDVGQALTVADRAWCLLEGRVSLEGTPAELSREAVAAAYFGV